VRDRVSNPCKQASKTTALYTLIFMPVSFTQDSVRQKMPIFHNSVGKRPWRQARRKVHWILPD